MEYRRFGDTILVRLDPKEDICGKLIEVAEKEQIQLAEISGLGAVNDVTTGVFDPEAKQYHANRFQGTFEIVSLTGTLTRQDGNAYLHVHMSVGDGKGNVFGGHLNQAIVSATSEIVIRVIDGKAGRRFSEEIRLNLIEF